LGNDRVRRQVGSTVGSKKVLPQGAPLATGDDVGVPLLRISDMAFDVLDRLHVGQRDDHRARLKAVGYHRLWFRLSLSARSLPSTATYATAGVAGFHGRMCLSYVPNGPASRGIDATEKSRGHYGPR
jgi:hypothetical protein